MALKLEIDSLDQVHASLREHYEETADGSFRLKFEGLEKLKNQSARYKTAEARVKELETEVATLRGNPAEPAELITPRERFIRENAKRLNGLEGEAHAAEFAKIQLEMQPLIDAEVAAATQYKTKAERQVAVIRKATIEHEAHRIIADIGQPGATTLLLPHVIARLDCEQQGDDWRLSVKDAAGRPTSIDALKEELRTQPQFRSLVRGATESETAARAARVKAAISPPGTLR